MPAKDPARSHWWHEPAKRRTVFAVTAAVAAAVPVTLVNGTAFIGQFAFLRQHVPLAMPGVILIAVAIESIAIYLAWHAHLATMANDSAMRLKLGAYFVALVVGAMNYSHYMSAHWRPTVMAVIMAMSSALSPWLWGVHTRRASRDRLMAQNLIEPHAVRLGATRWAWHVIRSARVTYWATWHGVNDPQRAIGHFSGQYGTADDVPPARHAGHTGPAWLAAAVPAQPDVPPSVPAAVPPDVPAIEPSVPAAEPAPPAAPETGSQPAMIPGTAINGVSPGTQVNGEIVVRADARLEADATLSGGKPSQLVIDEAEMKLSGMTIDDLPSIREIARTMLGDPNQRRLAAKLRKARVAAEEHKEEAPARESLPRPEARADGPQWIARPERLGPGGMNG